MQLLKVSYADCDVLFRFPNDWDLGKPVFLIKGLTAVFNSPFFVSLDKPDSLTFHFIDDKPPTFKPHLIPKFIHILYEIPTAK
jgi:hypothetical protein